MVVNMNTNELIYRILLPSQIILSDVLLGITVSRHRVNDTPSNTPIIMSRTRSW